MEIASTSLGIVRSRSRSHCDFEFFLHLPQYTVNSNLSAFPHSRKLWLSKYVIHQVIIYKIVLIFGILSCLSDLVNCSRRFNVDASKLYISFVVHARKLLFSSNVHLPSITKCINIVMLEERVLFLNMGAIFQLWNILGS